VSDDEEDLVPISKLLVAASTVIVSGSFQMEASQLWRLSTITGSTLGM
jgi:hypothetical protein